MKDTHVLPGSILVMGDLAELRPVLADRVEVLRMSARGLGWRLEEVLDPSGVHVGSPGLSR